MAQLKFLFGYLSCLMAPFYTHAMEKGLSIVASSDAGISTELSTPLELEELPSEVFSIGDGKSICEHIPTELPSVEEIKRFGKEHAEQVNHALNELGATVSEAQTCFSSCYDCCSATYIFLKDIASCLCCSCPCPTCPPNPCAPY